MPEPAASPVQAETPTDTESLFQSIYDASEAAEQQGEQPEAQAPVQATETPDAEQPEVQAEGETAEAPEVQEPETVEYSDLDDFLAKSELDRDTFLELPVTLKVDGQSSTAPLSQLIKNYQLEQHVQNKSQELANERKTWETQQEQAKQFVAQQIENAEALTNLAWQQATAEYQSINWDQLKADDPTQWAVKQQEYQQRANLIQGQMAQIQQAKQQQEAERQQQFNENLPKEREKALEAIPSWRDSTKFQADRSDMVKFGQQMGWTQDELNQIYDHRQLQTLHYASQYLKLQSKAPQTTKRVRTAPKAASPGARTVQDPKQAALQQAKDRLAANPRDVDAQVAVFSQLA